MASRRGLIVPPIYGMKNVKWVEQIEAVDQRLPGLLADARLERPRARTRSGAGSTRRLAASRFPPAPAVAAGRRLGRESGHLPGRDQPRRRRDLGGRDPGTVDQSPTSPGSAGSSPSRRPQTSRNSGCAPPTAKAPSRHKRKTHRCPMAPPVGQNARCKCRKRRDIESVRRQDDRSFNPVTPTP